MKSPWLKIFLVWFLLIVFHNSYGQEKCATTHLKVNQQESVDQFESWLYKRLDEKQKFGIASTQKTNNILKIPVVVHVIHNGENIGTGVNITKEQIISQIDVLNEDFRRLNEDAKDTPADFLPVAADVEVQFILALQDPEGLPTDGIVRVKGDKSSWSISESFALSNHSYWPAEDYLNIWVTNLSSSYIGYAQFPVSDLPGMEGSSNNRLTDGVVIDYKAFGSVKKYPSASLDSQFNLGRTATHEIGHFLGLRHIWGDGGCSMDDYCDDTPRASDDNGGYGSCTYPGPNSCTDGTNDLPDMFQNFMDYSDDKCMNIFTQDQKSRVMVVLANSPRRASLLTSHGLDQPQLAALDLGIKEILNPVEAACGNQVNPAIELRNYGSETITDFQIALYLNGVLAETKTISGATLESLAYDSLYFSNHGVDPSDYVNIRFEVVSVNGKTDYSNGNTSEITVPNLTPKVLPLIEEFNTLSSERWKVINYDNLRTWTIKTAPFRTSSNTAIAKDFYNDENPGEEDYLISVPYHVPAVSPAYLSFDYAYARYNSNTKDGLIIKISDDCGNTYSYTVFNKFGENLQTVLPIRTEYVPSGENEWKQEIIDLTPFQGKDIRVAFIAVNDYGNNLYLDNIQILSGIFTDLEFSSIIHPSPAQCEPVISPTILVKNKGNSNINTAQIEVMINGAASSYSVQFSNSLAPGDSSEIFFSDYVANEGINEISFELNSVNDDPSDFRISNNSLFRSYLIDDTKEALPLRETFENFSASNWKIINMDKNFTWELSTKVNNSYASFPSSKYFKQIDEDWIISPILDFSNVREATLFFDLAYSGKEPDRLQIFYSDDCGLSYKPLGYDKTGDELNTFSYGYSFFTENFSLDKLIGSKDVRIAFVATGARGNDIDIDNIEIFLEDNSQPFRITDNIAIHPNPAHELTNITFSLKEKEDIRLIITDQSGKIFADYFLPNTLNQTHQLRMNNFSQGVYLIKIQGETFQDVKKLILF